MGRSAPLIEHVCSVFGLGAPLTDWRRVEGGLSNELRRLDTTDGGFAVKRMIAGTHLGAFRANVEASFAVERAAVDAGVPAPRPISPRGGSGCLAEIECEDGTACWVRVHEWTPGVAADHRTISPETASELGGMLATVHGLELSLSGELAIPSRVGAEVWDEIVDRARISGALWANLYVSRRFEISSLEGRVRAQAGRQDVPGHRDADDKNTLVGEGGGLILIDWDAAGAVDAAQELTSVLLSWSGAPAGETRMDVVGAIRDAYFERAERALPLDASGWISAQLGWLHFNLGRALGEFEAEDVEVGQREVVLFLEQVRRIECSIDGLLDAWGEG